MKNRTRHASKTRTGWHNPPYPAENGTVGRQVQVVPVLPVPKNRKSVGKKSRFSARRGGCVAGGEGGGTSVPVYNLDVNSRHYYGGSQSQGTPPTATIPPSAASTYLTERGGNWNYWYGMNAGNATNYQPHSHSSDPMYWRSAPTTPIQQNYQRYDLQHESHTQTSMPPATTPIYPAPHMPFPSPMLNQLKPCIPNPTETAQSYLCSQVVLESLFRFPPPGYVEPLFQQSNVNVSVSSTTNQKGDGDQSQAASNNFTPGDSVKPASAYVSNPFSPITLQPVQGVPSFQYQKGDEDQSQAASNNFTPGDSVKPASAYVSNPFRPMTLQPVPVAAVPPFQNQKVDGPQSSDRNIDSVTPSSWCTMSFENATYPICSLSQVPQVQVIMPAAIENSRTGMETTASCCGVGIGTGNEPLPKPKPTIMIGRRRGGKALPTGVIKKPKPITRERTEKDNEAGNKSQMFTQYMTEVKSYRDRICVDETSTRPLVK